jgi:hypothetical protein
MGKDIDNVRELAQTLLAWSQSKVAHLQDVAAQAKGGTTFVVGDAKMEATDREALFFRLGVEAALTEIGTLPIKLTPQKPTRKRAG